VLVEGFKREPIPKIEIHRDAVGEPQLNPHDSSIDAIAGEAPPEAPLPRFDLDDVDAIAAFVLTHTGLARQ
jgi:molybdopterin-guanine dinucleotide biosynthesis protein B